MLNNSLFGIRRQSTDNYIRHNKRNLCNNSFFFCFFLFCFFWGGRWGSLKGKHVRFPQTPEAWKAIAKDFQEIWNLQHRIGVVGGKHVAIKSPLNSDNNNDSGVFRNSKMREQFFENKVHLPAADGSKIEGKFNK